jgi:hypothetical protein
LLGGTGCVDAPITPDQLEPSGRLRSQAGQSAFSAQDRAVVQQAVQVSAVLTADAKGPLEDTRAFATNVGTVHLHVRADGLLAPRPVVYRWTHDDISVMVAGMLAPSPSMSLGSSFEIGADQEGQWEVEVLVQPDAPGESPRVLLHRQFEVVTPTG